MEEYAISNCTNEQLFFIPPQMSVPQNKQQDEKRLCPN